MFGTRLVNSLTTANVIAPLQRSPPARAVLDPRKPGDGDEKLPKKTKFRGFVRFAKAPSAAALQPVFSKVFCARATPASPTRPILRTSTSGWTRATRASGERRSNLRRQVGRRGGCGTSRTASPSAKASGAPSLVRETLWLYEIYETKAPLLHMMGSLRTPHRVDELLPHCEDEDRLLAAVISF